MEDKKNFEYSTYLVASTLQNIEFDSFKRYNSFINLIEKDNYIVQGLISFDANMKLKELSKNEKNSNIIKKFERRLSFIDKKEMNDSLSISIKDGKKLKATYKRYKK